MQLATISSDCLRAILDGENSYLVIRLWTCGDRSLNTRLANGGVQDLRLRFRPIIDSTSRWPRMVKHLRLRSLSIAGDGPLGSCGMLQEELTQLDKGLKRLYISNTTLCTALLGPLFDASVSKHERENPVRKAAEGVGANFIQLNTTLPVLEELIIDCHPTLSTLIHPVFMASLPDSLTLLSAQLHDKSIALLPKHLRVLKTTCALQPADLRSLPSSLVELDVPALPASALVFLLSEEGRTKYPSLQVFPSCNNKWEGGATWTSLFAEYELTKLPERISSLTIEESLSAFDDRTVGDLGVDFLSNLTSLSIPRLFWPKELEARPTPLSLPSLTSLVLTDDRVFRFHHFCNLPRNLTSFAYQPPSRAQPYRVSLEMGTELPLYTQAAVVMLETFDRVHWDRIKALAEKSEEIQASYASNLNAISQGLHFGLPLTLTSLALENDDHLSARRMSAIPLVLPPLVTRASLSFKYGGDLIETCRALPPTLTELGIPNGEGRTAATRVWAAPGTADFGPYHREEITHSIPLIPSLTSIILKHPYKINPHEWKHLPDTLLRFEQLEATGNFWAVDVRFLPRGLTDLRIGSAPFDDTRWASFLPFRLRHCIMPNAMLLGEDFANLPRSIVTLSIKQASKITYEHIGKLPLELRELNDRAPAGDIQANDILALFELWKRDPHFRLQKLRNWILEARGSAIANQELDIHPSISGQSRAFQFSHQSSSGVQWNPQPIGIGARVKARRKAPP